MGDGTYLLHLAKMHSESGKGGGRIITELRGPHGPVRTPTHTSRPARVPNDVSRAASSQRGVSPLLLFDVISFFGAFHQLLKNLLNFVLVLAG